MIKIKFLLKGDAEFNQREGRGMYNKTFHGRNRTAQIRHLHKKTAVLSCHGCLINTGDEERTSFKYRLEL